MIDYSNSGKTIKVSRGQIINLTLGNPGDGGYVFDSPEYNSKVLSLIANTHQPPISTAIGDFGKDIWQFKALASGSSNLTITATRSFDKNNPVVIFSGTIAVN